MKIGTLKELDVKPGDVVECVDQGSDIYIYHHDNVHAIKEDGRWCGMHPDKCRGKFRIISRASEAPKTWVEMTPEEKGALLLAHHEGKVIERCVPMCDCTGEVTNHEWKKCFHIGHYLHCAYRIRPEPVREVVEKYGYYDGNEWVFGSGPQTTSDTHRITFDLIDGKPDCDSVKMERICFNKGVTRQ
jgi:hypothetical protein